MKASPTPVEIAAARDAIKENWSEDKRLRRAGVSSPRSARASVRRLRIDAREITGRVVRGRRSMT